VAHDCIDSNDEWCFGSRRTSYRSGGQRWAASEEVPNTGCERAESRIVRVSELVHIEVGDVDLEACKIFIDRGKGAKDRYILFPASFRLVLKSYLHATPRNRFLFETRRFGPFTTRRIQQIVQDYREMAGITQPLHPHLFRHQMLTFLTSKGLSDA
jgi:integrase/recombinase XerD